jgi:hypothetical protein
MNPPACVLEASSDYESALNMTESELEAAVDNSRSKFSRRLLVSDENRMWDSLSKNYADGGSRVDFVLNNAGFELYCDLALGT